MKALPSACTDRSDHAGHAAYGGPTCPRCNGSVYRVPRRSVDVLMGLFVRVRRYRCHSDSCGWEGNLRVKRKPLLIRGPW
jgi:hypothetical protein